MKPGQFTKGLEHVLGDIGLTKAALANQISVKEVEFDQPYPTLDLLYKIAKQLDHNAWYLLRMIEIQIEDHLEGDNGETPVE